MGGGCSRLDSAAGRRGGEQTPCELRRQTWGLRGGSGRSQIPKSSQICPSGLKGLHNLISFLLNSHISPSQKKSTLVPLLKSKFSPDILNRVSVPSLNAKVPPPKSYSSSKVQLEPHCHDQIFPSLCRRHPVTVFTGSHSTAQDHTPLSFVHFRHVSPNWSLGSQGQG